MSVTTTNPGLGGGSGSVTASAIAGTAVGTVVLPFTSGNTTITWIALAAIICGSVIILSKVAKNVVSRFIA